MKGDKPKGGIIKIQNGKIVDVIDLYLDGKYFNPDEKENYIFYLYPFPKEAGLYDENKKMIANLEEVKSLLSLNVDTNGVLYIENEDTVSNLISCEYYEENDYEICYRNIDVLKNAKTLVISNEVTSIGTNAFYLCINLTNIIIPDSVTSIEDDAFMGCISLTNITIPNSVTTIGTEAFYQCINLKSVTIGNSVTSIGEWAFYQCINLTNIKLGSGVTSIGYQAFTDCIRLTSIIIPSSVTSIEHDAFQNCTGLTSVIIENGVTSIGNYVFYECTGLTNIIFKNTSGWYLTNSASATKGTNIDVTNTSTNATNLVNTYKDYYWKRNV